MFLERLTECATGLGVPPTMYVKTRVRWLIDLDDKGKLLGFVQMEGEGRAKNRGEELLAPHAPRSGDAIRAKLLCDNGEYVLGTSRPSGDEAKVHRRHKEFVETIAQCADATRLSSVDGVLTFLETLDIERAALPDGYDPANILTFRVNGEIPIDHPEVRAYWASRMGSYGAAGANEKQPITQCVACGEDRPVLRRHPIMIKGVPGRQRQIALISANEDAFESYGLSESLIAPTCHSCAEKYAQALNLLIADESSRVRIGPLLYVFWAKADPGFSVASLLTNPQPDDLKRILFSAHKGRRTPARIQEQLDAAFYAAALSSSGARLVVRDWLDTTVGAVKKNLGRYFKLQSLVDPYGQKGRPIGVWLLAASLYRDANTEMVANVPSVLLRSALEGRPLPSWLLFQAVKRNRVDQGNGGRFGPATFRSRLAVVKMILLSQSRIDGQEDSMTELDTSSTDPAYLCGRLLAELEAVQRAAMPGVNATLVDRFFGTASSAPASVFGRLLRGAQPHLSKLRRDRRGTYNALQARLEEIQANLTGFPPVLTLTEQGMFALGYYHQRAADRAAAIAHKEGKAGVEEAPPIDE